METGDAVSPDDSMFPGRADAGVAGVAGVAGDAGTTAGLSAFDPTRPASALGDDFLCSSCDTDAVDIVATALPAAASFVLLALVVFLALLVVVALVESSRAERRSGEAYFCCSRRSTLFAVAVAVGTCAADKRKTNNSTVESVCFAAYNPLSV